MVDTSVQAELQNSIRQAQDQLMKMGQMIKQLPQSSQAQQLDTMCSKAGNLLREAQERCEQIM
ncbi:hypothetical protein SY88_12775 [Clostridiales bacterium PH28_bin88]|nr:hypothetical protein SY88_12775 [Clostridiales bacterium PH28_bin88]